MKKFLLPVALLVVTAPASAGVADFFGGSESPFAREMREASGSFEKNCEVVSTVYATQDGIKRGFTNDSCKSLRKLIQKIIEKQAGKVE